MAGYTYNLDGSAYKFHVDAAVQPATFVVGIMILVGLVGNFGIFSTILLWVGLFFAIFVTYEFLKNRRNRDFLVSPDGIRFGEVLIQKSRINSIDIRNSKGGGIAEGTYVRANFTNTAAIAAHEKAKGFYYVVSVLHGGTRTKLAGGLTEDAAVGLVADINRALSGVLS